MRKNPLRELTFAAVLGGAYAALTILLPIPQYAGVQFRLAEALTLLPFLIPASTPGLFVGCLIANILSPYGPLDMIAGSLATLLACLWTQWVKNRRLAALPPVVCNAVIVGGVIAFAMTGFGPGFWVAYAVNALTVGLGECIVCWVLGGMLLDAVVKIPVFRSMMPAERIALMKQG